MRDENRERSDERESEEHAIVKTLSLAVKIFKGCNAEYRVLGSTLIVAHTGNVFRHIGDLDVLLDEGSRDCVLKKLKDAGFTIQRKKKAGFPWIEAMRSDYLGFTFLLVGEFAKDYFRWRFLKICELRIKSDYLAPTRYNFGDASFIGIPLSSVISGIRQSFLNPKRRIDKRVLEEEIRKEKVGAYGNINVYIFGVKIPFLYDIFSFFYNVYGGIRVLFGRKYEIWN